MASLDEIWDAPVTPNSPKAPRTLDLDDDDAPLEPPAKRQRQTLFLSDSEDDDQPGASVPRGATKAPPRVINPPIDEDVEALFADAENDDQLSFKRVGDFDIAAMEKEAEERHRRAMPLTPHPVMPSSSPARDGEATATSGANGKEKEPIKRRKPLVLNENLLLGPTGFPDLISQLKDFKVKGKGHEVDDLTRLMRVYNFWAHRLYPKVKFRDTVVRVEKLCHSKRMNVALSVWRDEAKGKTRDPDADLSPDSDDDDRGLANADRVQPSGAPPRPRSEANNSSVPPSPRASSQPPTSGFQTDGDLFGPPTSNSTRSTHPATNSSSTITKRRIIIDDDEDDDEEENLWKQFEEANAQQPAQNQQQPASMQSSGDLDDEEMWAALDAASTSMKPATGINAAGTGEMDIDDEDIWDIVKENEKTPPQSSSGGEEEPNPTIPIHANQSLSESEMGFDDMYTD